MVRKANRCAAFLFAVLFVASCAYKSPDDPNARPGKGLNFFPEWYDNMIGEQYGEMYATELPVLRNASVQKGVEELGEHLVRAYYGAEIPPYQFEFHVVNLDIMNAFALPGGKIFVFRGLLQDLDSEDELAGVLSHEIGHVVARHGTKNISKSILFQGILLGTAAVLAAEDHDNLAAVTYIGGSVALSLRLLKYSRDYEREADWVAVHNCYRAGYNPEGLISLFEHFKDKQGKNEPRAALFLSTHPGPEERQKNVRHELPKLDMAREWNTDLHDFQEVVAELKSLPPAPKELDGKPVLSLNSMDSLGSAIAGSRTNRLSKEFRDTGRQTVKIYVPSNEEWTGTAIDLRAGQRVEFRAQGRNLSSNVGILKGMIRKGESEDIQSFTVGDHETITVEKPGQLYLGILDSDYQDNEGWYVVTTQIK